jgi:hypothetical protein
MYEKIKLDLLILYYLTNSKRVGSHQYGDKKRLLNNKDMRL